MDRINYQKYYDHVSDRPLASNLAEYGIDNRKVNFLKMMRTCKKSDRNCRSLLTGICGDLDVAL